MKTYNWKSDNTDGNYQEKPDLAIVVFGEQPYAEGNGDLDNLEYQRGDKKDLALLKKLKADGIKVVSIFITGRPLWVNPELNASDAFVVAWLPGSEGGGVADVLFKNAAGEQPFDFKGALSFSWPATPNQTSVNRFDEDYQPLLPYGYGLKYGESDDLTQKLPEDYQTDNETLSTLALFDRAVQSPWSLWLSSKGEREQVISSTQSRDLIAIRTIDKVVQEDALELVFSEGGEANISIRSDFPSDLRTYSESNASLTLNVKVDTPVSKPIYIGMNCEQKCESFVDVSGVLAARVLGQWQSLKIDLKCFENDGVEFGKIFSPFTLKSSGALNVSLADIHIEPASASLAEFQCE